jgi:hypothetical protein
MDIGEIDMGETTTNTKKWESVPDVAKRLIRQQYSDYCSLVAIRQQYSDYCSLVADPKLWWIWLKEHFDLEK